MGYQQIIVSLAATILAYVIFKLGIFIYAEWTSPLHNLPGPSGASIIYGNMKQIEAADASVLHDAWVEEYGSTIKYKGFLGMNRMYTTDTKALNHILMNTSIYQKPEAVQYNMARIVGNGVLVVEGDKHKQQRKIMNPAFGAAQIRELTEIFVEKSILLRDIWAAENKKEENKDRIDVLSWLSRMTLDVIGLAGFNYKFDALTSDPEKNELNKAFSSVFRSGRRMTLITVLRSMIPSLRPILHYVPVEGDEAVGKASKTMARIGNKLLKDSKSAILTEKSSDNVEKSSWMRRDLLSLLLRANMATDLPPSQRMLDEDVISQVPTFLVAGHETTSTATTWALFALTQAPEVQEKLRKELLTVSTDNPTMDELNALPYLDAVVRETLRVHAPVPSTLRMAVKDDILPLAVPVKGKDGRLLEGIKVSKGQTFLIPILAMNRTKAIWGEDAREFKPERWMDSKVPDAASSIPGVWGNMMTFLGGPRACIGYRFSLVEMKALLFTLVRAFEFELAVPAGDLSKSSSMVQRPTVISEKEKGNQMPLRLRPVRVRGE